LQDGGAWAVSARARERRGVFLAAVLDFTKMAFPVAAPISPTEENRTA